MNDYDDEWYIQFHQNILNTLNQINTNIIDHVHHPKNKEQLLKTGKLSLAQELPSGK